MNCPSTEVLQALRGSTLPADLAEHLKTCEACQAIFGATQPSEPELANLYGQFPSRIGRYHVLDRLGEGGMGTVYAAYHPELDRRVALKVLRSHVTSSADAQNRLLREAQSMARLTNPNVLAVYDVGRDGDIFFIVMELVDGESLAERLQRGAVPPEEALEIIKQAARGLAAAHRAGLVHRDFKPANILLSQDGRVRVADFGIAQPTEDVHPAPEVGATLATNATTTTKFAEVSGTPPYMAPEQFDRTPATKASDQFSFCVTAFEMLYGTRPFDAVKPLSERFDHPRDVALRGEPKFVRQAILRGLSKNPAHRFASIEDLLAELERERLTLARVAPWAALVLALVCSAALLYRITRPPPLEGCEADQVTLNPVWSSTQRSALQRTFDAVKASAAGRAAITSLDEFAANWAAQATTACAAPRTSQQPERTLACLQQQRLQFKAVVDVFADSTEQTAVHAPLAAAALVPPERCADPNILASLPRVPEDPTVRTHVEEVRAQLANIFALNLSGRPGEAIERLPAITERVRTLGFRPLDAEAAYAESEVYTLAFDGPKSFAAARRGAAAALSVGLEIMAADELAMMGFFAAYSNRLDEAEAWLEQSRALLTHAGGNSMVEARIENSASVLSRLRGNWAEELAHQERAVELRRAAFGPKHPRTLAFLQNLSSTYAEHCDLSRAVESLQLFTDPAGIERAPALAEQGLRHLGEVYLMQNDLARAEAAFAQAASVDPDDELVQVNQAIVLVAKGRLEEASAKIAPVLERTRAGGEEWVEFEFASYAQIEILLAQRRFAEASTIITAINQRHQASGRLPDVIELARFSSIQVGIGQFAEALESVHRARELIRVRCALPRDEADLALAEATALKALKRDPARVTELALRVVELSDDSPRGVTRRARAIELSR